MKATQLRVHRVCLLLWLLVWSSTRLYAQGITTGAVTGTITDPQANPVSGAQVQVINRSTGYATGTLSRGNGLYLVQGLEVGGPYSVIVTYIGFEKAVRDGINVVLSQATRVDIQLTTQAVAVAGIEVNANRATVFTPSHQGVGTTITDSLLRKLPTFRDFTDLTKLTPQVIRPQDGGGASAGGQYNRFNSFTIDGANQSDRFGLNASAGTPGGAVNARLISMEAVKEFRVLLTPTDVRQGNFTGMLVNAVTKSGTNELHGGGTFTFRNQDLSAVALRTTPNKVQDYSFSFGGPILRNKLHFLIAPEFQSRARPMTGQYVGATAPAQVPNVSGDSLEAIRAIMLPFFDVGTTGQVSLENPITNLFGRLDYSLNDTHRMVFRQLVNRASDQALSRNLSTFNNSANVQNSGFRLGSNQFKTEDRNNSSVFQFFSNFASGTSNEVIAGYNTIADERIVPLNTPEISVGVTPIGGNTPTAAVTFGTEQFSPGNLLKEQIFELTDNLTLPHGAHTFVLGGRFEHSHIFNNFAQRSYGVYTFANIAALRAQTPIGYTIGYDNSGTGSGIPADFSVEQYSLYGQDQIGLSQRFTLTAGVRIDMPRFLSTPLDNPQIDAAFAPLGVKATDTPKTQALFSPRLGFNFDPSGDQKNQIRGNIGVFTGPPPFILIGNPYSNTGRGLVTLICSGANTPAFTVDVNNLPKACKGQAAPAPGAAGTAGVNLTDPNFKYPQSFTTSFGFDRQLPYDVVFTFEGVYRHAINGVLVRDLNLKGPRLVGGVPYADKTGRVLYADTISAAGAVTNNNRYLTTLNGVAFSEGAIQVTNQSKDYNATFSGQLYRRFHSTLEATVAYTHMVSKDVQSLTSDRAISNWRNGRQVSGTHDDLTPTTSYFSRPDRFMAFGTYTLPWKITSLSFYYEGISGTPLTYTVNGDLNGDLYNANDPIYVPKNAADATEFKLGTFTNGVFTQNLTDAQAFDAFIAGQPCLNSQRGKIMERDSCRSPFQHRLDVSLQQSIPTLRAQKVTFQVDVFNFLNLLNKNWGQISLPTLTQNFPQQQVLGLVGRTPGPLNTSDVIYSFNATAKTSGPFIKSTATSNYYQIQLTGRYSF